MTVFTSGWYCNSSVIGIGGLIIIIQVATDTSVRCIVVIVIMAKNTIVGNGCMSSCERVIIGMDSKSSRLPARVRGVTICAGIRDCQGYMVGIS